MLTLKFENIDRKINRSKRLIFVVNIPKKRNSAVFGIEIALGVLHDYKKISEI